MRERRQDTLEILEGILKKSFFLDFFPVVVK